MPSGDSETDVQQDACCLGDRNNAAQSAQSFIFLFQTHLKKPRLHQAFIITEYLRAAPRAAGTENFSPGATTGDFAGDVEDLGFGNFRNENLILNLKSSPSRPSITDVHLWKFSNLKLPLERESYLCLSSKSD